MLLKSTVCPEIPSCYSSDGLTAWLFNAAHCHAGMFGLKHGLLARGVSETKIMFGHVLRNCLMPLVTLVGISFGTMLGGSTIVESIFTWPGVGKMAVDSITSRDYPVIQGYVVWMALIFLFINALVEISYSLLDPRLRKGKGEI